MLNLVSYCMFRSREVSGVWAPDVLWSGQQI